MATCVLLNPSAGTADAGPFLEDLRAGRYGRCLVIPGPGDGARLAREMAGQGVNRILVAGGDGTVHAVVNGLMGLENAPAIGVVPLGTGNDLARTLHIPLDPERAMQVLEEGEVRLLDVLAASFDGQRLYCANVAAGGLGGELSEGKVGEAGALPSPLRYLAGLVKQRPELEARPVVLNWADGSVEVTDAVAVVVANARTAAGGVRVAPRANPEDGLLDVVVVGEGSLAELARVGAKLVGGDYTEDESVSHRRGHQVSLSFEVPVRFSMDGEPVRLDQVDFRVLPAALPFVVGPDYSPDPPAD